MWVGVTSTSQSGQRSSCSSSVPQASWTSKVGGVAVDGPAVAPAHEGDEGGGEVAALGGEPVLVADRALLVGDPLEDAGVDQLVEAVGEDVAGDAEVVAEVAEAADAPERVAQDQQRPPVADEGRATPRSSSRRSCRRLPMRRGT